MSDAAPAAAAAPAARRAASPRKTPPGVIAAKALAHLLALTPAAILGWQVWEEFSTGQGGLGADPVAEIEHRLGLWALRFLMIALAVTPLRQLSGQAVLLRFRRLLGLYAFFYASLHFAAYLVLDLRGYWTQVFEEIAKRPYITVGFLAWLGLVPLAITSTQGMMRRLGRLWGRLHQLVYAIAVLAVLHFWWLVKSDIREPALYAGILAALLGWRVWKRLSKRRPKPL
ncbi:protein-methionine-sulfoxide reductase heme-binding subunit MsrQ [Lysobacter enzymogenes]|uniref:protein-methionine-sulfoxide reductase heme-binding subunit MsrQ n=1 Tax=Lysobacter enzymogenes TaxID=69 RepID=UPI00099B3BAB|nr:protein-methionine-sulfoxide reductase heme-binding subunit MsrQ [Lysobacter enzymogenes]UZW62914.1 protein-methionine-sulfoxide reductase heme-binding subunit MsrQ [Lysobacter enzymogenes]